MYRTLNDHDAKRKVKKFYGEAEFYAACKDIQGEKNGCVFAQRDNRLIAFWDDWSKQVKPGFGAYLYEKGIICSYSL